MRRRNLVTTAVGTMAAASGLGWAWWKLHAAGPATTHADAAWWQTRFDRPEGGNLVLADFKGRPLLLNFWATWCPPCVKEMPMLDTFARAQGPGGFQVVGLALDNLAAVHGFLKRVPVSFPIAIAGLEGLDLSRALGNTAGQLPFTTVWDGKGGLAAVKLGPLIQDDLTAWSTLK